MKAATRKPFALVVSSALALVLAASAPVPVTDAAWQDRALSSGTFAATTVPAPTLNGKCSYEDGLLGLGAYVRIHWKAPAGYTVGDADMLASTGGLGSVLAPLTGFSLTATTTGSAAGGYVTDVPVNLLGGVLGLGAEIELAIVMKRYGWTSQEAAVAASAGLAAGLGGTCRNITP